MGNTSIEWTDKTWNCLRGCTRVSAGCQHCYAEGIARRFSGPGLAYEGLVRIDSGGKPREWNGAIQFVEKHLLDPLKWKQPKRIFVNSMSDLFHENVTDEMRDKVFAVMALCPQHTFQVLTKRPERMALWANDKKTPFRVAKQIDCIEVSRAMADDGGEDVRPVPSYPGYFVSNRGNVFSGNGSATCLYCGGKVGGIATKRYCTQKCRQNAGYLRRTGRKTEFEKSLQPMSTLIGEFGHMRVMLYREGQTFRELIHRMVLSVFDRPSTDGEMGCHRNGDAENCHIANLRWGMNEDNWEDRKRHGNGQSWSRVTDEQAEEIRTRAERGETFIALGEAFGVSATQISNITHGRQHNIPAPLQWPLPNCHLGVSCEDQAAADKRIPILLQTPAAVRFISAEPLLGPIDLRQLRYIDGDGDDAIECEWNALTAYHEVLHSNSMDICATAEDGVTKLDWVIAGGESGPGARPCNADWIRGIVEQCTGGRGPSIREAVGRARYSRRRAPDQERQKGRRHA